MFLDKKSKDNILSFLRKVPFLNCLCYFSFKSHKKAALKLAVLWVITTSPIIISILLSDIDSSGNSTLPRVAVLIGRSVSTTDQLIYVAAFLTPIMYIWFDRMMVIINNEENNNFSNTFKKANKSLIDGYGLIVLISIAIIFFVALGYGALKVDGNFFANTNLAKILESWSWYIYLFSVYCWYLSILDSQFDSSVEAIENMNEFNRKDFEDGFNNRVGR